MNNLDSFDDYIKQIFHDSSQLINNSKNLQSEIKTCIGLIIESLKNDKKIVLFGNGGSAADAQHIAAEFVGRFSMVTAIDPLTEEQLVKILTEPRNALIKQTQYLFNLDNIKIEFTKDAKEAIAKRAKKLGTNARGLKNILDTITLPYQFDAAEMRDKGVHKIQITQEVVVKGADPVLLFNKSDAKKQQIK